MPGNFLKFAAAAVVICAVAVQAGAQEPSRFPAEVDATTPERDAAGGKPAGDNARKAAEARVESTYRAAMTRCDGMSEAEKSICTTHAEGERAKGMADITAPLRTPPRKPSTRSMK